MPEKFSLFREELRRAYCDLRGGESSPKRAAVAVALGTLVGTQPVFGVHTPLLLVLCVWFQLDSFLAILASNISNPFFAPALVLLEVEVGASLRAGKVVDLRTSAAGLSALEIARKFLVDLAIGAPVVGVALALAFALATFAIVLFKVRILKRGPKQRPRYTLPENAPPFVAAATRLAARYGAEDSEDPSERSRFHYVRIKLLTDPIAKLISEVGLSSRSFGEVLDIGTGRGQLPLLLLELGLATRVRGFDWDTKKIEEARRATTQSAEDARHLAAAFDVGDSRDTPLEEADTVFLIDVLHYVSLLEQDQILKRAMHAVRPGGRLILREADTERGLRSLLTQLEERVFTAIRWNVGERVKFRPAREIVDILESAGFSAEVRPAWGHTPFSNVLIVAERPAAQANPEPIP